MTTADASAKTLKPRVRFRLPDPRERHPDEVTGYDQVHLPGNSHFLLQRLGNPETALVGAERHVVLAAPRIGRGAIRRSPDLFIAFGVDPQAYRDSNGCIISEQGKPPDFALEAASPSTADVNTRQNSPVLNLHLRWEDGRLGWYDPATGRHIPTFEEERAGRIQAEARAAAAEARVRELEEELRRRQNG